MISLLRLFGGQGGRVALAVLLGALTVLSGVGLLATSGALIVGAAGRPESLLVLFPLIAAVRLFGVSRAGLRYAERLASHDLTFRLLGRVRGEVLARLTALAPAALTGERGGDLLARVRADVDELQNAYLRLFAPLLVASLACGVTLALLWRVSPATGAVTLALFLLAGALLPLWAMRAGRRITADLTLERASLTAATLETLRGLADVLAGGARPAVLARWAASGAELARGEAARARVTALAGALREGCGGLGLIAALWLIGEKVASGGASGPLLAGAALGVLASFEAVGNLGSAWVTFGGVQTAWQRVEALGALSPTVTSPREPLALPGDATLRWEGVSFRYPSGAADALRDFALTLAPGERVALIGPSGAGKSTALRLALRFWDPGAGRLTLGAADLRDLDLEDLRAQFAWAPQQAELFDGTLRENLLTRARDEDVLGVLGALHLGPLLDRLPEGLSSWVGEYGARLSAGERARLSVARALLRGAPILLLDEPTAHLDPESAARVLRAVDERAGQGGVLLITQQPDWLDPQVWRLVETRSPGGFAGDF